MTSDSSSSCSVRGETGEESRTGCATVSCTAAIVVLSPTAGLDTMGADTWSSEWAACFRRCSCRCCSATVRAAARAFTSEKKPSTAFTIEGSMTLMWLLTGMFSRLRIVMISLLDMFNCLAYS